MAPFDHTTLDMLRDEAVLASTLATVRELETAKARIRELEAYRPLVKRKTPIKDLISVLVGLFFVIAFADIMVKHDINGLMLRAKALN
jgi:hypothetical protein